MDQDKYNDHLKEQQNKRSNSFNMHNNQNKRNEQFNFNNKKSGDKSKNNIVLAIFLAGFFIAMAILVSSSSIQLAYFPKSNFDNLTIDVNVTNNASELIPISLYDGYGDPIGSHDNALKTHEVPHSALELSVHLTRDTGINDTIQITANKGDQNITVSNGSQFTVGDKLKIIDGYSSEYDFFTIKVITNNTLRLDRILDAEQTAGKVVKVVEQNMAVDGSVTPVEFSYQPRPNVTKFLTSLHLILRSADEPSVEKFGGILALTYGFHCRIENPIGRDFTPWIPFRSNNAFMLSGFTYQKETKVGGGDYFVHMTLNLRDDAISIILLNDTQKFTCRIQDDLTDLTAFELKLSMYDESGLIP